MRDVPQLPKDQRIKIAQLGGAAAGLAIGRYDEDPIAVLHEISTDPDLLGMAAASHLVQTEREPRNQHAPKALAYLRAAGADEQVLAEQAVRVRARMATPRHKI